MMGLDKAVATLRAADEELREAKAATVAARKLLDLAMVRESEAYEARSKATGVLIETASPTPMEEADGRD